MIGEHPVVCWERIKCILMIQRGWSSSSSSLCVVRCDWLMLLGGREERRASSSSDWQESQEVEMTLSAGVWTDLRTAPLSDTKSSSPPCVFLWIWQSIISEIWTALLLHCLSTHSLQTHWDSSTQPPPPPAPDLDYLHQDLVWKVFSNYVFGTIINLQYL